MMDRNSDAGGKADWMNRMPIEGKQAVIGGFVNSVEFTRICQDFNIERGTYNH